MSTIETSMLTKDYGDGRGIFDIDLNIEQGEMLGFVGTNGSGKTKTIRSILGFIKPINGSKPVVGSSRMMIGKSAISAATSAVFCFMPLQRV